MRLLLLLMLGIFLSARGPAQEKDLYAIDRIVDIEIKMLEEHWPTKLQRWKENFIKNRVLATVSIDGVTYDSVGVRYKGNSSYNAIVEDDKQKLPFNLKISYVDKTQRADGEYKTIKLSNGFRDPTYLREPLSYAIANEYMPSPRCNFARLTIDGKYYGVYNLSQSVDRQFWLDHYGSDQGIMFKCDPESKGPAPDYCPEGRAANLTYLGEDSICYAARYELKKADAGWAELIDLTKKLNVDEPDLEEWLNVDEALWMHAFNNALSNLDSYLGLFCHNYYLYQDTTGIWHPIIWDLNLSLGGFAGIDKGKMLSQEELFQLSPFVHFVEKDRSRPFLVKLLERPLFRKMYVAHLKTIYEDHFVDDAWKEKAERMRKVIAASVAEEPIPLYPKENFDSNYVKTVNIDGSPIVGIQEFFDRRGEYLGKHPLLTRPVPTISTHTASVQDSLTTVTVILDSDEPAEGVWIAHRPSGAGNFNYLALSAEDERNYQIQLPNAVIDEYFLVAEGKISASVLPERSAKEWFTVQRTK